MRCETIAQEVWIFDDATSAYLPTGAADYRVRLAGAGAGAKVDARIGAGAGAWRPIGARTEESNDKASYAPRSPTRGSL